MCLLFDPYVNQIFTYNSVNSVLRQLPFHPPYPKNEKTTVEHTLATDVLYKWCPDSELNQGHGDFQSPALPTELSGQKVLN